MSKVVMGCHLSSAKGYLAMGKTACVIGANTFQFFSRNPRGGNVKALDVADLEALIHFTQERQFGALLVHAPYTLNPCSKDAGLRAFAYKMMMEDLERLELFPDVMYNLHPGSHVNQGAEVGIGHIADMLKRVLEVDGKTPILLETMAGKGSEIGGNFQELARIIEGVEGHERIGICLDTCHIFDGGYDIVSDFDGVLQEFEEVIGIERLKAIHLNDSKNSVGSRKDRHEQIGRGFIGLETFEKILNDPRLKDLPFYLETPHKEVAGYGAEISLLRGLRKGAGE